MTTPHTPRARHTRRAFLGAAGGAAALTTLAAAGCSAGSTSGTPEPGTDAAGSPRRGGRLRATFAGGGASETLDPHRTNLFVEAARAKALFDKLADFGSDMSPQPRLAESWEPSTDATRWTVRLREAVFTDGTPLTAADVLHSYRRITDPEGAFRARASLESIDLDASRAVDDRTVEFVLKHPYAEFPNALAAFGAYIVKDGAEDFTEPVGTGPFRFVSFTPGSSMVAARHDAYWDGAPYLDEIEFLVANEETARINALLGGQVEYAHELTPTTARTHEGGGQVTVVRLPRSAMQAFVMKTDRAPFDDPRVREAFFLIADRQQLVDSALAGAGEIGNDLFGKGYQYYADSIPQRTRDLDRARALLREAGAENLTVRLDTSEVAAGFVEAATVFAEQAAEAGVTVEVVMGNKDTYWSDILDSGQLCCYRSGSMPIESHISQRLLTDSTTNASKWQREDFDALYEQAQATLDEAARTDLYARMQRTLHAEGGFLVWGFADWIIATANNVGGVDREAPANSLGWARFDKVWLA
ncbi:ABC transporter substrate-binding protein [Allostreptomyces psammosilenae]|uniref:Peptide/nickel transport system substrate-binding protein n=1 Tax=Allostreptomyces psammosilenae TaxID=1892865 RepID=A0A853A0K4_9ACTN|nr:ABC transporter substrate-binding protein [Allostreptomyces psammosilenae]NYI07909.1 peptide/nickel transport system substrate-binding protein [Allostreptomyces psammosilenae]